MMLDTNFTNSQRRSEGLIAIWYPRNEPVLSYQRNLRIAAIIEIGVPRPKPDDLKSRTASTQQAEQVIASR